MKNKYLLNLPWYFGLAINNRKCSIMLKIEVQPIAENLLQNKTTSGLFDEFAIANPKDHILNAIHISKNVLFIFDFRFNPII